jgi:hypothetical protein
MIMTKKVLYSVCTRRPILRKNWICVVLLWFAASVTWANETTGAIAELGLSAEMQIMPYKSSAGMSSLLSVMEETYVIKFVVNDESGNHITGATVKIDGTSYQTGTADTTEVVLIRPARPATYTYWVNKEGYTIVTGILSICDNCFTLVQKVVLGKFEEPGGSHLNRPVTLPSTDGVIYNIPPGKHYVASRSNFIFTIKALNGGSLEHLTVTTGTSRDQNGGVILDRISADSLIVTIKMVNEPLTLTIWGVRNASDIPSLDGGGVEVWSYDGQLYIRSPWAEQVRVYALSGQLYKQQRLSVGETQNITLPTGFYIVSFEKSGVKRKVVIAPR